MKKLFLSMLMLIMGIQLFAQPVGWASVDFVTDGGRGENPVVVSSFEELKNVLKRGDTTRQTIYLKGRIDVPGLFHIRDVQNKSIIGLSGSVLANDKYTLSKDSTGILALENCKNIILQNITFKGPGAFDRDASDNLSMSHAEHIWVDHCDFQDGMDGNFDCNQGSDYITVSYCRFRYLRQPWPKLADDQNDDHNSDHRFSNLLGSSDREGARSAGKLRTTFDHCWWDEGCRMRMPFVRFGQVHLLNCLYSSSVALTYIQARYQSNILVDACAFVNMPKDIHLYQTSANGREGYRDYNIRFRHCLGIKDLEERHGNTPYFTPPYSYAAENSSLVEKAVKTSAGATLNIRLDH